MEWEHHLTSNTLQHGSLSTNTLHRNTVTNKVCMLHPVKGGEGIAVMTHRHHWAAHTKSKRRQKMKWHTEHTVETNKGCNLPYFFLKDHNTWHNAGRGGEPNEAVINKQPCKITLAHSTQKSPRVNAHRCWERRTNTPPSPTRVVTYPTLSESMVSYYPLGELAS